MVSTEFALLILLWFSLLARADPILQIDYVYGQTSLFFQFQYSITNPLPDRMMWFRVTSSNMSITDPRDVKDPPFRDPYLDGEYGAGRCQGGRVQTHSAHRVAFSFDTITVSCRVDLSRSYILWATLELSDWSLAPIAVSHKIARPGGSCFRLCYELFGTTFCDGKNQKATCFCMGLAYPVSGGGCTARESGMGVQQCKKQCVTAYGNTVTRESVSPQNACDIGCDMFQTQMPSPNPSPGPTLLTGRPTRLPTTSRPTTSKPTNRPTGSTTIKPTKLPTPPPSWTPTKSPNSGSPSNRPIVLTQPPSPTSSSNPPSCLPSNGLTPKPTGVLLTSNPSNSPTAHLPGQLCPEYSMPIRQNCVCVKGYTRHPRGHCAPCGTSFYKDTYGDQPCVRCPDSPQGLFPGMCYSALNPETPCSSREQCNGGCQNQPGWRPIEGYSDGVCEKCPRGYYGRSLQYGCRNGQKGACCVCPVRSFTPHPGARTINQCHCLSGWVRNPEGLESNDLPWCIPCSANTFRGTKDATCQTCPAETFSQRGSVYKSDCRRDCAPGQEKVNGVCRPCVGNTYRSPDAQICVPCPMHSEPNAFFTGCECSAGFRRFADSCVPCGEGTFKNIPGPGACQRCGEEHIPANNHTTCICDRKNHYFPVDEHACERVFIYIEKRNDTSETFFHLNNIWSRSHLNAVDFYMDDHAFCFGGSCFSTWEWVTFWTVFGFHLLNYFMPVDFQGKPDRIFGTAFMVLISIFVNFLAIGCVSVRDQGEIAIFLLGSVVAVNAIIPPFCLLKFLYNGKMPMSNVSGYVALKPGNGEQEQWCARYAEVLIGIYAFIVFFIYQIITSHIIYIGIFQSNWDNPFALSISYDNWDVQLLRWSVWVGLPLIVSIVIAYRLLEYYTRPGPAVLADGFLGQWFVDENYVATIEQKRIVWADRLITPLQPTTRFQEIRPEAPADAAGCRGILNKTDAGVNYILWTSGDIWSKEPHEVRVVMSASRRASLMAKEAGGYDLTPIEMEDYYNQVHMNRSLDLRSSIKRKRRPSQKRSAHLSQTYLGKTPGGIGEVGHVPPPPSTNPPPCKKVRSASESHLSISDPKKNKQRHSTPRRRGIPPPPSSPPPPPKQQLIRRDPAHPRTLRHRKTTSGTMFLAARPPMLLEPQEVPPFIIEQPPKPAWFIIGIPFFAYFCAIGMFIRDKYSIWIQIVLHFLFHFCLWMNPKKFFIGFIIAFGVLFVAFLFLINLRLTLGLGGNHLLWSMFL